MSDTTPNREPNDQPIPQNPYAPRPPEPSSPERAQQPLPPQPPGPEQPAQQQRPDYSYPVSWQQTPDGRPWPPPAMPGPPGTVPPKASGLTIAAIILGVVAACLSLVPFVHFAAFPVGLAAVIVAGIAMTRKLHSRALAIAGLSTGIASLVIALLWTLAFAAVFSAFESFDDEFGALGDWTGPGEVEAYTFEAWADVPAEVEIYTGLAGDGYRTEEIEAGEPFSEVIDIDVWAGSVTVIHYGDSPGEVGCRILDGEGHMVSEDIADSATMEAMCWPDDGTVFDDFEGDDPLGAGPMRGPGTSPTLSRPT
ncbi:hypothetical protein [Zhihengliuella halotolerans]|uniref:hypothetical protein n=1 Tax=Zhihengliuella halotolerans TaxID=370736 RepID=UPI000C804D0D|nr:hypothetical protein [Zhihengliuella halotolerans]